MPAPTKLDTLPNDLSDSSPSLRAVIPQSFGLLPPGRKPFRSAEARMLGEDKSYDAHQAINMVTAGLSNQLLSIHSRLDDAKPLLDEILLLKIQARLPPTLEGPLLEACCQAVALLSETAHLGLGVHSLLRVLEKGENIGTTAAIHALMLAKPEMCLEILEQSRALFWTDHFRFRTALSGPVVLSRTYTLQDEPEETSGRVNLVRPLSIHETRCQGALPGCLQHPLTASKQEQYKPMDNDAAYTRSLPRSHCPVLHDLYPSLSMVASHGPVITLVAGFSSSYAIIIRAPGCPAEQLALPGITAQWLHYRRHNFVGAAHTYRGLANKRGVRLTTASPRRHTALLILEELWYHVMQPIVECLKSQPRQGRTRPRLWICGTGAFAHIPLHAAGAFSNGDHDRFQAYHVTSYTPTLGTLLNARCKFKAPQKINTRALLASASRPPQWPPLPYADEELFALRSIISPDRAIEASTSAMRVGSATCNDILTAAFPASILHLACHGHHDRVEPLESGFVMQDGVLTVSQLMSLDMPHAFFAFLSACGTACGDDKRPNQIINLASTMLFIGFKSVVATMWSMGDMDGPLVAAKVYQELFRDGADKFEPDVIPYALDEATHELRKRGVNPARWATYAHFGL